MALSNAQSFPEQTPSSWDTERLNLALAAARLGDWSWDPQTDLVTFSQRAAEIFAIPPGPHMTWTAMRRLLHPEDRERARLAVEAASASRGQYSVEYRLVNGGRERWVLVSGRGRYEEQGELLGMYGVVQDITRDRLLLHVDDAVRTLVDPEAITETAARMLGQYLEVERCAYAVVDDDQDGFSLTGNYTNGVQSMVGRYRFRQFGAECLRLMRAGETWVVEDSAVDRRIDQADRRAYELSAIGSVICVPLMKSGRLVAAMAVHTSSSRRWTPAEIALVQQVASRCWESIERARVEREREALLEVAQAANRTKDEFLAMLGHELRNPLAPILTSLQLMKLRGDASSDRERTVIERQVRHLARLVDDLLDVSRIARGKVELEHQLVELADVVSQAVEVASPLFEQRHHVLVVQVPRGGLTIRGDQARLTQVVSNLLTNAGKYTPTRGRITISGAVEGAEVVLTVRDTGLGMAPEVLPHVFELFVQGPQANDRALGGLGLGLAIVRSLVERHGGTVRAHSEGKGQGSEFVVRLPHAQPGEVPASPPPQPADTPAASPGRRLLVVDDNEDAAETLAEALRFQGCEVEVAHDAPAALRLAANLEFDAALLDIGLPVMDGYELAGRLRALPNLQHTRLIAVTGYGQESDRRRAIAAGFHHHLVKPVDLDALDALVANLPPRAAA